MTNTISFRYKYRVSFLALVCIAVSLLTSCKTAEKQPKKTGKTRQEVTILDKETQRIREAFLDASKYKILGQPDKAIERYLECLSLDPGNSAAMYELSQLYHEQKNIGEALKMAAKAAETDPSNIWYLYLYAQLLEQTQQFKEAIVQYKKMIRLDPVNPSFYEDLAQNCIYMGKLDDAIRVYDDMEKMFGLDEVIVLQKQKIYLALGKNGKAIEEIEKLVSRYPEETRYYSILAETYMSNGYPEKARELYQKILEMDPSDPYVHIALSEYYRKAGEKEKSFDELNLAFTNPELSIDTKIQILLTYLTLSDMVEGIKEQSYHLLDNLIKIHPKDPKAWSIYGDFLYHDQKLQEAKDAFLHVISLDSSRYAVWEQLIRIEAEKENYANLAGLSARALALFPEQPLPFLFRGMALFQLKNYRDAATVLRQGASLVVDNDELEHTFYSMLGDTWNELKEYAKSDEAYEKSLRIKPEDPYVLNNYSYYLSLRSEKLERAEQMARKANELSPGNPSYLDTHAWVLYKMNRLEDAEKRMLEALEKGGNNNPVILEHYGDILYKKGMTDKALEYWQKAKDTGPASDLLEKKLRDKKLYE